MVYHEFFETEKENDEHVSFLKLKEKMVYSDFSETEKEKRNCFSPKYWFC